MYNSEQTYIKLNEIYRLVLKSQTNEYNKYTAQAIIKLMDLLINMEGVK